MNKLSHCYCYCYFGQKLWVLGTFGGVCITTQVATKTELLSHIGSLYSRETQVSGNIMFSSATQPPPRPLRHNFGNRKRGSSSGTHEYSNTPTPAKGYKQDDFKYTFINEIISSTSSSRQKGSTSSKKERKFYTAKPLSSDTHTRMYPHYVAYLRTLIFDF